MDITDILSPDHVVCGVTASSKKRTLELVSELLAEDELSRRQTEVFDSLIARERLGSTGFGVGVAIPHGRVKSAQKPVAAFVKLDEPVDYDAIDGQPVDLVFALVVPEASTDEHLQVLAMLAEMFSNKELCKELRALDNKDSIYQLLSTWQQDR